MKLYTHIVLAIAGISGAVAVSCGAFGAHGLAGRLSVADMEIWKTAALYHLVHSVMLVCVGVWMRMIEHSPARNAISIKSGALSWVAAAFACGMLIFSGSLYALVLTNMRWLGAITPIGGLLLIVGWLWLAWTGLRNR